MTSPFAHTRHAWLAATATLAALALSFVPAASAHAPIEWSEPKAAAVVAELPETVKVRFADEPASVAMRTIEPEPRAGVPLKPVRIGERTYEVALTSAMISPTDNKVVIFIETLSTDGHTESGVYVLYVVDPASTTTTSSSVAPVTLPGPAGTTPAAVFAPPVSTKSATVPMWFIGILLASSGGTLVAARRWIRKRS